MSKRRLKLRKKKNNKSAISLGLALLGICAIVICTVFLKEEKVEEKKAEEQPQEEMSAPEKKVQVIDLESHSRPVAVMINNNSAVWSYQSGLNDAYIVYEMLVEGGITREMALYKDSKVGKIQSIRSSRHYYLDYALENDAVYVHWGWSPQAQSDISSLKIDNINGLTYEGIYFFRDSTVKAGYEHRGYITMENIEKAIDRLKYRKTTEVSPLLAYSPDELDLSGYDNVEDARYVEISFSNSYAVKFFYDEDNRVYKRSQNKIDMYDFTSKERITSKNIIIYQIGYSNIPGDDKGRLNANNVGSGDGYYISEGKAVPITWEKTSRSSKTKYRYKDGSELVVNDGNTYIGILPKNQKIEISAESQTT